MKDVENIRGSPRLLFTKEELETPELEKPIAKVQKAQKKYDSARKKLRKGSRAPTDSHSNDSGDTLKSGTPEQPDHYRRQDKADSDKGRRNAGHQSQRNTLQPEGQDFDGQSASAMAFSRESDQKAAAGRKAPQSPGKKTVYDAASPKKTAGKAAAGKAGKPAKDSLTGAVESAPGTASRLVFEEDTIKRPSKMKHPSKVARTINTEIHRSVANANEDENVAASASMKAEQKAESALRMGDHVYHMRKQKPFRELEKAEKKLDRANVNYLQVVRENENPSFTSNPYSRWQQKRAIRKEYAAAKAGKGTSAFSVNGTRKKAEAAVSEAKSVAGKAVEGIRKRPGRLMLLALLGGMLLLVMGAVQSCTPLAQSVLESLVIGTYPATEDDVRAAERAYANKENELKYELEHYEAMHPGYDEYNVEMDEIEHNPYVLIAIISAVFDGQDWTIDTAMPVIEKYFNLQYKITETIKTETRYRTETQAGTRWVTDPDTGQQTLESYTYEASVPYEYTICNVEMENRDLSHTPVISMSHHTMGMYALYMATHGNMEGIFAGNPHAVPLRDPYIYDIPQETLDAEPQFAKLMEEANKYVGYPYVWGGASPETSFDCSGFVSYVFTTTGVCNTGRRGAKGLYSMCRTVSEEEVRPGDLVFFAGTMGEDTEGITHVGIYVGNHHMIHCGSPCGYADLNDYYWRQHFFAYGRLPY